MTSPSKTDMLQELFGVKTTNEAMEIYDDNFKVFPHPNMSLWVKMQLPYEAPNHPDIPSLEAIEQEMKERNLKGRGGLRDVCKIGKYFVKRCIDRTILQEAEDILFLRANSQVRVPTVYAVFVHDGMNYLVMEFLEGGTLSVERLLSLSCDARTKILSRLCEQFQLLRSIPSPEYYGRVHHQGWGPRNNLFSGRVVGMCGPYDNYHDLISASVHTVRVRSVITNINPEFLRNEVEHIAQYESTLATCSGLEPKFTHMDPNLFNIIARPIREGEDWEVTLIDWAESGWLPAWMQAVIFQQKIYKYDKDSVYREEIDQFVGEIVKSFGESYPEQLKLFREKDHYIQPM